MNDIAGYLEAFGFKVLSTSRLCQVLGRPEWELSELLKPLVLSGRLSFQGENNFGIDLWRISNLETVNFGNALSFSLARLDRVKRILNAQNWHKDEGLIQEYELIINRQGMCSEIYRQVADCLHLLAKGKSAMEIYKLGYSLNFNELGNWYVAFMNLHKKYSFAPVDQDVFKSYKIVDRLSFNEPRVIGLSHSKYFNSVLLALGLFISDLDGIQITDPSVLSYYSASRYVFVPLTEKEKKQVSTMDSNDEVFLRACYQDVEVIFRSSICKVIGIGTSPPYLNWTARSVTGNVDFVTPEGINRLVNFNHFGERLPLLTTEQKDRLLALL